MIFLILLNGIFSAIYNLYQNGATRITVVDIDNYLDSHPGAHSIFTKKKMELSILMIVKNYLN